MFFFFQKNPSHKKCFLFEGAKLREDWLVEVNCFTKNTNLKNSLFLGGGMRRGRGARVSDFFFTKNLNLNFFFFWGGGGGGGGGDGEWWGGARVSDFFLQRLKKKKQTDKLN